MARRRRKRNSLMAALGVTALWLGAYMILGGRIPQTENIYVQAATNVSSAKELRTLCESGQAKTICLSDSFSVKSKIEVKGNIKITGGGKTIYRLASEENTYKGILFSVVGGGSLTLSDVTISGNCKNKNLSGGTDSRLIEVDGGGRLVLESKSVLKENYNSNKEKDGGGAIVIKAHGVGEMNDGLIEGNRSMTGGGAVRIHENGTFYMHKGKISANSTKTKKKQENFDGRGGAIHNLGVFYMDGGEVSTNVAEGTKIDEEVVGGIGGGIYNKGTVTIVGGEISGNSSSNGGAGIYTTDNSGISMHGGSLNGNISADGMGGGIYVNNGARFDLSGGSIQNNLAKTGGGIYISKEKSEVTMNAGLIYGNQALGDQYALGGGVRNNGGTFVMKGGAMGREPKGQIVSNAAPNGKTVHYASALYVDGGTTILQHGVICNSIPEANVIVVAQGASMNLCTTELLGTGEIGILNKGILHAGEGGSEPVVKDQFNRGVVNHGTAYISAGSWHGIKNAFRNYGSAFIRGGSFTASSAIHQEEGVLELSGGACEGTNYGVYGKSGQLCMKENANPKTIFLKRGCYIDVTAQLYSGCTELTPEDYEEDRVLVHTMYTNGNSETVKEFFKLKEKKPYYMKCNGTDLCVGVMRYNVIFHASGGVGKMEDKKFGCGVVEHLPKNKYTKVNCKFIGWARKRYTVGRKELVEWKNGEGVCDLVGQDETITLYAVWGVLPFVDTGRKHSYYEDEYVDVKLIKDGITATDKVDGDITDNVRVTAIAYENGDVVASPQKLDTKKEHCGTARMIVRVENSMGFSRQVDKEVTIVPNKAPEITGKERYFFLHETEDMSKTNFEELIKKRLVMTDDIDEIKELCSTELNIHTDSVNLEKPGKYTVCCELKDQYGNRPYMGAGEKRRYGSGKTMTLLLAVHILEETPYSYQEKKDGQVRFIAKDKLSTIRPGTWWRQSKNQNKLLGYLTKDNDRACMDSEWHFPSKRVHDVKLFLRTLSNPFQVQSNETFLKKFISATSLMKGGEYE